MQWTRTPLTFLFVGMATTGVIAQQARDDGGAARLQAMVQQLTSERTQLQADNKKLKTELDAANAELKKLRDEKTGLERRVSQSESSLSQTAASNSRNEAALAQQRTRMDQLVAEYRKTAEALKATELDRNDLKAKLDARSRAFDQCAASNQKLFETGNEVLDRYEEKGCFASVREKMPFTQNTRVRMENLVDTYRWALEDQKLPEAAQKDSTASANDTAADR